MLDAEKMIEKGRVAQSMIKMFARETVNISRLIYTKSYAQRFLSTLFFTVQFRQMLQISCFVVHLLYSIDMKY